MLNNKIQALLIGHLQKHGSLRLLLPDGIVLEIGTNQVSNDGELVNVENYCWVITSKEKKSVVLDSYNTGVRFSENSKSLVFESEFVDCNGDLIKRIDVV